MWRKVTEADLTGSLSTAEIEAFRRSDDGETDVIAKLIAGEVAYVRGIVRSSPAKIKLNSDPETLPESLIMPAMDHLRFNVLTRMDLNVNDSRTKAYENANTLFEQVRRGEFAPESDGEDDGKSSLAGSPASGKIYPHRLLD